MTESTFEESFKKLVSEKGAQAVRETMERITQLYGSPPLVTKVLAEDPEYFITCTLKNKSILHKENSPLTEREVEIAAIAAATALRCEHCLDVHIKRALELGVPREAALQTIMVAAAITESSSWSTAFRKYRQATARGERDA
ncbi:MAG: carboxymuconolactone decarboxylase family protein [Nitrospinae bacterium]|nr:carboxymuconolactone decarboxylase family protein [Nitrospinota bacterium]